MADSTIGTRDERGDWRPYVMEVPAPLAWPPRPLALFKYMFGWPGYIWPWNAFYLAVAVVTWFALTPALTSMQTFELWWIALVFGRNLGLAILYFGGWHAYLYVFKGQGDDYRYSTRPLAKNNKIFTFNNQVLDNMFWTLASGVTIWSAYEVVTLWAFANGFIPFAELRTDPVWFVVLLLLIPLIREVHFYLTHRLLHWKPLYELAHKLHHRNVNIGPWAGMSMHPIEHILYMSGVLVHWVLPSHPIHALFHMQHAAISPAQGHTGYERVAIGKKGLSFGTYAHYLHHKFFECNYGGDGLPLDALFGTFHDGSDAATERMNKRLQERQWAKKAVSAT